MADYDDGPGPVEKAAWLFVLILAGLLLLFWILHHSALRFGNGFR